MTSAFPRALRRAVRPAALVLALTLGACAATPMTDPFAKASRLENMTPAGQSLEQLPAPSSKVFAAVYEFADRTGQHKPNQNFAEYSRAVTQGGAEMVVDALYRAGGGQWFHVAERRGLQNLLRERQVIRGTREEYQGTRAQPLNPLKFAGIIIEGGVVGYDSDVVTGGAGARFLGVGASTQYRRDVVSVAMRAVSVRSGEVIASVSTTKTVYSVLLDASVFTFVGVDEILELEAGASRNERPALAVRQAIELAVYALIMEGATRSVWHFKDKAAAEPLLDTYRRAKAGNLNNLLAMKKAADARD
ncbi:curli production assembly/transport component CsgG [Limimonas halophila]|uniref:Curli production assembly/transport component CsgG n=1 Tax=Limimonas halophila TaxID=1082479 RepID=A0A1G7RFY1_9PROT|nr:CsgG/HfaB family protein [Limimonas halophila]SDG09545.1 curli production assembly/transport component CsgG [Limimonas halophila]